MAGQGIELLLLRGSPGCAHRQVGLLFSVSQRLLGPLGRKTPTCRAIMKINTNLCSVLAKNVRSTHVTGDENEDSDSHGEHPRGASLRRRVDSRPCVDSRGHRDGKEAVRCRRELTKAGIWRPPTPLSLIVITVG